MSAATVILDRLEQGDPKAAEELLPIVYDELRGLASAKMAREPAGHTLQPTALVHEAWLRLGGDEKLKWQNRTHFIGAAAEAMRRILVENARKKLRQKRGGGQKPVEFLESVTEVAADEESLLQVHEAIEKLEAEDPIKTQIVKLRYFVGLTHLEIATLLAVNEKTVRRHWEIAKLKLFQIIRDLP